MATFGNNLESAIAYFQALQQTLFDAFTAADGGGGFIRDNWQHANGGGGCSGVLEDGMVFEKGGVNFSHVFGDSLPASATATRSHVVAKSFEAAGVSVVMHPRNPFVPTAHMNVRILVTEAAAEQPIWWFGGGYDLTPCYGFDEDCVHWHRTAKQACDPYGAGLYPRFKKCCDQYFYLKHRNEPRGIGGLFFDDYAEGGFAHAFGLAQSIGNSFTDAYLPIVARRKHQQWRQNNTDFQQYRRGRYVEFNLLYDRGTIFGLQSGGRVESILMSLPPAVQWRYDWQPAQGTAEARLYERYLRPRDWLAKET